MNLTYVLGAGASANALPKAKNMAGRIGIFIDHLKKAGKSSTDQANPLDNVYKEIVGIKKMFYSL